MKPMEYTLARSVHDLLYDRATLNVPNIAAAADGVLLSDFGDRMFWGIAFRVQTRIIQEVDNTPWTTSSS